MKQKIAVILGVMCFSFLFLLPAYSFSAPKASLWSLWLPYDANSSKTIDYSLWQSFLDRYVTPGPEGVNLVNYAAAEKDRRNLVKFLLYLQAIHIEEYNRKEQMAYWINLYNAATVMLVMDNYPIESIRDIWYPWSRKRLKLGDKYISLNDIEHRILRPIWHDPRIHYAVNCASMSCPNLQKTAYTANNLEAMLDKAAREYVNSPRALKINNGKLEVSKIYVWYQSDFGDSEADVIQHLSLYAKPALKKSLEKFDKISGSFYNWSLNDDCSMKKGV